MRITILTSLILLAASTTASATGSSYESSTNGQKACDPALPVYDSNLRQRPRGAVNEATDGASVFATCGFDWQQNSYGIEWIEAVLTNVGASAKTVTCTAVIGREGATTEFLVKSVSVPARGTASLRWSGPSARWQTDGALSCRLPDETGVARTVIRYRHSN